MDPDPRRPARGAITDVARRTAAHPRRTSYFVALAGAVVAGIVAYLVAGSSAPSSSAAVGLAAVGLAVASSYGVSAAALRHARPAAGDPRVEELRARVDSLSQCLVHLDVFGETLADTPDLQTLLARMVPMIERTFDANWALLHLLDDDGSGRVVGAREGVPLIAAAAVRHVLACAQPVCVPHPQGQTGPLDDELAAGAACGSLLAVPLITSGKVTGVLAVGVRARREFSQLDTSVLSTIAAQIAVAVENAATYRKLEDSYLATVAALASAMEANDEYTADHAETVARMAVEVGERLDLDESALRQLHYAGLLHDIGKIGVPDPVLNKEGALDPGETATMVDHTTIGERIIAQAEYLRPVAPLVRAAHERWDGRGYPDGLAGENIPLASRIVFVCDAFHAMISDRPYRRALSLPEALNELRAQAGRQFDPRVVEVFARAMPALTGTSAGAPAP